jgi:predicted 3-demethylubiquinone-9 3-methyltransferase (glyoxalase superfamily)
MCLFVCVGSAIFGLRQQLSRSWMTVGGVRMLGSRQMVRLEGNMASKNTICLWFDGDAEEAASFYAATFPDSEVTGVFRAPGDFPGGSEGDVLTVEFTVFGTSCLGLNGGPFFTQSEAFSFQIATDDQVETDRYWDAIVENGGQESECGWCKDKWGVSWQITPRVLTDAFMGADRSAAKRAFDAMMTMRKIDVAIIESAIAGA